MRQTFIVSGMTCAACIARVEKVTKAVPGVVSAEVNLLAGTMIAEISDPKAVERIIQAVAAAGYEAQTGDKKQKNEGKSKTKEENMTLRLVGSALFTLVLMYFTMGHMFGLPMPGWYHGLENAMVAVLVQFFLTLPVIIWNRAYYIKGLRALFHGSPNMDTLIAVGSGSALVYGIVAMFLMGYAMGHGDWDTVRFYAQNLYFESATMILTLITFGKYLEGRAKGKTGDAIRVLMDLRPQSAIVERDGQEIQIPADSVRVGDILVVRSGQKIPVDGTVLEGHAWIDQSALTGESVPVEIEPGSFVSAATVNTEGFFRFRADKVGEDTTFQQVIRLVEHSGGTKAPIARLADKIAGIFVPVVMVLALIAFGAWYIAGKDLEFCLTTAISVLVISCPCALGLATPVAIMVGIGRGASLGVLFKNGSALEQLHSVQTVIFDKTGTLTQGKPAVTDVLPDSCTREELLSIAGMLEMHSEHPFAQAIMGALGQQTVAEPETFETLPGRGVSCTWKGKKYYGGNARLMAEIGVNVPSFSQYSRQGKTPLYFADAEGHYLGAVFASDTLKSDAIEAVSRLKKMGLEVVMLTGDNETTAQVIANQAGVDRTIANVLPSQKADAVKRLQVEGKRVLMVGDGINDAPALVSADVGMAIGAGTDIAMESADVVLMGSSLTAVCDAIALSKATIRNIKENLFWAFFYNCLCIPVAAGALYLPFGIQLSPMIGAAAMSFSSVFVVSNALRLRNYGKKKEKILEEPKKEKPMDTVIIVEGMMCVHCKATVEKVCKTVPGVENAVVDLQKKTVTITGNGDIEQLKQAITDAGYEVVE